MTEPLVTLAEIQAAREALAGRVHRTPLLSSRSLSERCGGRCWLKAENLQRTGSFKARGALNRVRQLSAAEKARGLVSVSAGNHAAALGWAARAENVHATVVMPAKAVQSKVDASRAYGTEVVLHGTAFEAFEKMEELRRERGLTLVHPFDDTAVIAGQGTLALEVFDDLHEVDVVVVPVGGGGLISGVAAAVRALRPSARVYGVEPEGAPSLTVALEAGHPVRLDRMQTIADGLAAPSAGPETLRHVTALVEEMVLVGEARIAEGVRFLAERAKLVAEPAGAAGVAALLDGRIPVRAGERVVVIVSGGNVDRARLAELLG